MYYLNRLNWSEEAWKKFKTLYPIIYVKNEKTLTKKNFNRIMDIAINIMIDRLIENGEIKISRLGKLYIKKRKHYSIYHKKMVESYWVKFKPSKILERLIKENYKK